MSSSREVSNQARKRQRGQTLMQVEGVVLQTLPNAMFQVRVENGMIALAYISGKIRKNKVRIRLGDIVCLEISPYDYHRGRITWRWKAGEYKPEWDR